MSGTPPEDADGVATWFRVRGVVLFVAVSAFFLASRWQLDLPSLARFESHAQLADALGDFPRADSDAVVVPATCPLTRRQLLNLRLVALCSKLVLAMLVAVVVFAFFLVLVFLAVDQASVKSWIAAEPRVIFTWPVASHTFALTWEHLKVSGFLAVFTGLYFSVVSVTDASLRDGLRDTAEDAVRGACAARLVVLAQPPCERPPA